MNPLVHLTMNTGNSVEQPRSVVGDDAIKTLLPLVQAGGGSLPGDFSAFRVEIAHEADDHGCLFTVWRGRDPIVTCALCWGERDAAKLWNPINDVYLDLLASNATAPDHAVTMPASVPWLAVIIDSGIAFQTKADISWLGDFERCLAWTIIESMAL